PVLFAVWDADRDILTSFELQVALWFGEFEHKTANVMSQGFDDVNRRSEGFDGNAEAQNILIVVDELYFGIAIDVRTTEQDIALIALILWQGEGGVFFHLQIAVQQERFAGSALAFPAPMRQ